MANYTSNIPTDGTFTKIDYPIKKNAASTNSFVTYIDLIQFGQTSNFGYNHNGSNPISLTSFNNWVDALEAINQFLTNINARLEALENGSSDDPVEPTYYIITWNSAGGSNVNSSQIEAGSMLGNLPTTSRSGYNFNGWYTASSGGSRINESTIPTKDTTYYAHWTAQTTYYTITWNSNGGSSVSSSQIVAGSTLGSLPTTSKSGYDFDGWYTSSGTQISSSTIPSGNTTYYAHWTASQPQTTYYIYAGMTLPNANNLTSISTTSFTVKPTTWQNNPYSVAITNNTSEDAYFYYCFPTEWYVVVYGEDKTTEIALYHVSTFTLNGVEYTVDRMGRKQGPGATQNLYAKC